VQADDRSRLCFTATDGGVCERTEKREEGFARLKERHWQSTEAALEKLAKLEGQHRLSTEAALEKLEEPNQKQLAELNEQHRLDTMKLQQSAETAHREHVEVDRLVKVCNDLQDKKRHDGRMALSCATNLDLRQGELQQSRLDLWYANADLNTQRDANTKLQCANHELDTLNIQLRNSIHNRGLEGVDSQELLELQPGGQTAHSSDKLRVLNERSNGQRGLSMYECKLDGDKAKFDWYENCEGDVDILDSLMRWFMSVTNESDAYTST